MKIKLEHYNHLKNEIAKLNRDQVLAHKALELGKDKAMRFRWDLFHAAKLSHFASDNLSSYLNDNHIDTALKGIVKELEL
jgi:hypothetical protein